MAMADLPEMINTKHNHLLRSAQSRDIDRLIEMYGQLHHGETADRIGFTAELKAISALQGRKVYVFEVAENVVGTIDVFLMRNLTRNQTPWVGIENFVVDESQRRNGFGREILETVIGAAASLGAYKVQLISSTLRKDAHDLYTAVGFAAPVSGFRKYLKS
jgi:GNAT superfamily N-acetyltransferase